MSTTVSYKGSILTTVVNQTKKMLTAGKYMEDDVTITDISSGPCDPIVQDQNGYLVLDEFCDNIGEVYQDEDGFIVFGSETPSGLEYEEGTWTPSEDSNFLTSPISFTNVHTDRPFYVLIADVDGTEASAYSVLYWAFIDWYDAFGSYIYSNESVNQYARRQYGYKTSSQATHGGSVFTFEQDMSDYVTSNGFIPQMSTTYYWRAGRTYKWIAVWAP